MDKSVLQFLAILFLVFILYLLFKYTVYFFKKNRLQDFSLKVKGSKNGILVRTVKKISSILKKISFIKCKKYNGYARFISSFEDGYDVISSKILCSLFMLVLYVFVSLLYKTNISVIMIIVSLILGYVLLDFYYIYSSRNTNRLVNKDMLGAVIIMNNDFKANRSPEQAINDVVNRKNGPISKEFKRVLEDTNLGLSYGEAFLRMYKRTKIPAALDLSHAFSLYNMIGSDLIEIFDEIEEKIIDNEKFDIQVKSTKVFNRFFKWLFNVLPVFIVILLCVFNERYKALFLGTKGVILISIIVILFIIYIVTINKIVRRYSYDNK